MKRGGLKREGELLRGGGGLLERGALFTICMLYNVFNKWNCFVYLVKTSHCYPTKILEGDRSYLMEMTAKYRSNKP